LIGVIRIGVIPSAAAHNSRVYSYYLQLNKDLTRIYLPNYNLLPKDEVNTKVSERYLSTAGG